jgi:hypothetical protein
MRLIGDVSPEHRQLAVQLEEMEEALADMEYLSKEHVAKAMVCLAHDWYDIGLEEEGQRLLAKANEICPDYFVDTIKEHAAEDDKFDILVKRLFGKIVLLLISTLRGQ